MYRVNEFTLAALKPLQAASEAVVGVVASYRRSQLEAPMSGLYAIDVGLGTTV